MTAGFDRRAFLTTVAVATAAPSIARAADGSSSRGGLMGKTWETMSVAARDAAFNNQLAVGADKAKAMTDAYVAASAALRAKHPGQLGLAYGPTERNKWDLFAGTDPKAPCFVFIFGGWWQRNSRESFSCVAEGVLAHGWSAAFPDYTLAPNASLTEIARELRSALDWLAAEGPAKGIAGPIILSGWSAGGHLSALLADHPLVKAAMPVSGVFELGPIRDCPSIDTKLKLTDLEVQTLSPLRLPPLGKPITIAYGTAELPGMVANSRDFHAYRAGHDEAGSLVPVPSADHFSILRALRAPEGLLTRAALALADDVKSSG